MGNNLFDNLNLAKNNARKNIEITKPLGKIDWSNDKKIEKEVKKVIVDLENAQVWLLIKQA